MITLVELHRQGAIIDQWLFESRVLAIKSIEYTYSIPEGKQSPESVQMPNRVTMYQNAQDEADSQYLLVKEMHIHTEVERL